MDPVGRFLEVLTLKYRHLDEITVLMSYDCSKTTTIKSTIVE